MGHTDGTAAMLEQAATGIPPTLLDAATLAVPANTGRRGRALATGEQALVDGAAAKVLHGWLQNRHQTLFPLAVNLRTMPTQDARTLMRWMAAAALTGGAPRPERARGWLAGVGAPPDALSALDDAFAHPPPLHEALAGVVQARLSAYAYVAAIVALEPHDPATAPFLDYAATRLALPAQVVRSANRRYRPAG